MANMIDLLIKGIVVLAIVKTAVGGTLPPNAISSSTEQSQIPLSSNEDSNDIVRNTRNAYYSPHQYYANYYNDYYNNYYNQLGYYNKPSRPVSSSSPDRFDGNSNNLGYYYKPSRPVAGSSALPDRFDGNSNNVGYYYKPSRPVAGSNALPDRFDGNSNNVYDREDNNIFVTSQGTKYVYKPIFQYKATHQKRHKLFVPTIGV